MESYSSCILGSRLVLLFLDNKIRKEEEEGSESQLAPPAAWIGWALAAPRPHIAAEPLLAVPEAQCCIAPRLDSAHVLREPPSPAPPCVCSSYAARVRRENACACLGRMRPSRLEHIGVRPILSLFFQILWAVHRVVARFGFLKCLGFLVALEFLRGLDFLIWLGFPSNLGFQLWQVSRKGKDTWWDPVFLRLGFLVSLGFLERLGFTWKEKVSIEAGCHTPNPVAFGTRERDVNIKQLTINQISEPGIHTSE